jgi:integrase
MSKAWIYQDGHQVKKHGADKASHYVGWIDPDGKLRCKSCGPGAEGKKTAEKLRKKREAELITGTYQSEAKRTWQDFRKQYEEKIMVKKSPRSQPEIRASLDHFERIINPKFMRAISTRTIDEYVATRRTEPGKKRGDVISPATVNKDLRHLRAALSKAKKWADLREVPDFEFEREPEKLPTYVTPEHFCQIYDACEHATMPTDQSYPAVDWWRALLFTGYLTGWRISELLALRRPDLDLDTGHATTRAEDNKGKRDERAKLHPDVVAHLRKLPSFDIAVFPWKHDRRTLQTEFARIQEAAGIHLACDGSHEHTRFCHVYGFHDLRRAFATMNAERLTADALQKLMRHRSYLTTKRYINMARQLDQAVDVLYVPQLSPRTG